MDKKSRKRPKSFWQRLRSHNLKNHPFVIPVSTFVLLFFVSMVLFVVSGGQTIGASDTRVVRLSIDGQTEIIPTRARTVGELVERLEIAVDKEDIIEPKLDTPIIDDNFSVNIYTARPVLVVDEDREVTTVTAKPEPREVAKEAGLKIYPEDIVEKEKEIIEPQDVIREGLIAEKVVIERATPANINLYGNQIAVRTHAKTVAEVLAERNIKTLPDDVIRPALDTPLEPNTQVIIARVGTEIVTEEETIPAPVEVIKDPTKPAGTREIQEPGSDGEKIVTYEVQLRNGQEVDRTPLQEVVALEPIKRIVVEGTKVIYSNPSANVTLGQQIAAEMGWGHEFSCIYQIFQRESGWNHLAQNRSSGAYGIPQALPGSKMGPGWQSDPVVQIRWGIGYMVGRYGSPCGANAFWQVNHWY